MELLKVCKCIYCGEGDNLLFCSSIECPVFAHLKCVEKVNMVVENDKFYCDYCCFKREVSVCVELLGKKDIAREGLEGFISFEPCSGNEKKGEENSDFILVSDDDDDVEENVKDGEDNCEGRDQTRDERVGAGEKQVETNLVSSREDGGDESISDWDSVTLAVYSRRNRQRIKSPMPLRMVVSSDMLSPRRKISKSELIEEKKASFSKQLKKSEESLMKITNMQLATEKRKRLYWKPEEEETLMEGVHKFSATVNKNIPWRKILEFGRHIFDSSRTPTDLKDKWRTMNK